VRARHLSVTPAVPVVPACPVSRLETHPVSSSIRQRTAALPFPKHCLASSFFA